MDISIDLEGDVALIKMDDGKKNAITLDALASLNDALDKADAEAKAIVLAGRPGSFCAGFDLAVMMGDDREKRARLSAGGARMTERLFSCPKPVIAACTGHGFTIGAIWMGACDWRIGETGDYKLGLNETKLGMPLPDFALEPLKLRIKPDYLLHSILGANLYGPEEAVKAGYLDEVVTAGKSIEHAMELAAKYAQLPAHAYGANKLKLRAQALEIIRTEMASLPGA